MRFEIINKKYWHNWFAWRPVIVGAGLGDQRFIVWFEHIEKREEFNNRMFTRREYRFIRVQLTPQSTMSSPG